MSGASVAPFVSRRSYPDLSANSVTPITPAQVPRLQFKPSPPQSSHIYAHPSIMEPTVLLRLATHRYPIPSQYYPHISHYRPVMPSQSSYLRASVPRQPSANSSHMTSMSSGSPPYQAAMLGYENSDASSEYNTIEAAFDPNTGTRGHNSYGGEYQDPLRSSWMSTDQALSYNDAYMSGMYSLSSAMSPVAADENRNLADQYSSLVDPYIKQEEYLSGYDKYNQENLGYTGAGTASSVSAARPLSAAGPLSSQHTAHTSTAGMTHRTPAFPRYDLTTQSSAYGVNAAPDVTASYSLQPGTPFTTYEANIPRYVHPAQVSPNLSPATDYVPLEKTAASPAACDPRTTFNGPGPGPSPPLSFTSRSPPSQRGRSDSDVGSASVSPPLVQTVAPGKRRRTVSFTSTSSGDSAHQTDGGESERENSDEEGDSDDEYQVPHLRRRTVSTTSTSSRAEYPSRRVAPPVPVPNLTKKSRGRHVPTAETVESGVGKNTRMYVCKVADCGKCFARGEHLKRHVRSIHTHDKPHKCPCCGKDFSRHDNLGQHMRVHKSSSSKQRRFTAV